MDASRGRKRGECALRPQGWERPQSDCREDERGKALSTPAGHTLQQVNEHSNRIPQKNAEGNTHTHTQQCKRQENNVIDRENPVICKHKGSKRDRKKGDTVQVGEQESEQERRRGGGHSVRNIAKVSE